MAPTRPDQRCAPRAAAASDPHGAARAAPYAFCAVSRLPGIECPPQEPGTPQAATATVAQRRPRAGTSADCHLRSVRPVVRPPARAYAARPQPHAGPRSVDGAARPLAPRRSELRDARTQRMARRSRRAVRWRTPRRWFRSTPHAKPESAAGRAAQRRTLQTTAEAQDEGGDRGVLQCVGAHGVAMDAAGVAVRQAV